MELCRMERFMTEQQFLNILEQTLSGEIPAHEVRSNLQYYRDYINSKKSVKSEEEVMLELGDPRLIARTIIDTYRLNHPGMQFEGSKESYQGNTYKDVNSHEKDYENGYEDELAQKRAIRKLKFMSWTIGIGFLLVLFLVLGAVFWIGGIIFKLFIRFILPALLIVIGIAWIRKQFQK